jgi:hypothetical protein
MLTRMQIMNAINDKIKAEFSNIPILSSDSEEGINRPSFFVSLETNRVEAFPYSILRDMTCRIRFFPANLSNYREEVYDVMDRLDKLFALSFTVGDRTITISGATAEVIDKVLHYDFDFSYYDDAAVDPDAGVNTEKMRELLF